MSVSLCQKKHSHSRRSKAINKKPWISALVVSLVMFLPNILRKILGFFFGGNNDKAKLATN